MSPDGRWAVVLARAGVDGDPRRWSRVALAGGVALAVLGAVVAGPGGALTFLVVAVASVAGGLRAAAGRGARRADAALPDLLEQAARSVRAGFDLPSSLERAAAAGGPHGHQLHAVVARLGGGAPLPAALAPWAQAHPRPPVRLAVAALEVAVEAGGARARALDGVAMTIRNQVALDAEVRALASQAQASAAVLVALPLVFAVVGSAVDPRLAHTLLARPIGLACVAGALVLDLAGAWWMHRIVTGAASGAGAGAR